MGRCLHRRRSLGVRRCCTKKGRRNAFRGRRRRRPAGGSRRPTEDGGGSRRPAGAPFSRARIAKMQHSGMKLCTAGGVQYILPKQAFWRIAM